MPALNSYRGTPTGEWYKRNAAPSTISRSSAGSLQESDWGNRIEYDLSADGNITLPPDMPEGWQCVVIQRGTGRLTFVEGSGVTRNAYNSQFRTLGQWAEVTVTRRAANNFALSGDLTA